MVIGQNFNPDMCVDLHTHSLFSDGTDTPSQLVRLAVASGLSGLALTDHDTAEGCGELREAARETGLQVMSGIEISCMHGPLSLHMLGYGIDPDSRFLRDQLERIQEGRRQRNQKILARLRELGIGISERELLDISRHGQTGRPHIARLLVRQGVVDSMDQAFNRYLGRDRPAYVQRFSYSATETIAIIHRAGGVAVLAHPGLLDPLMRIQPVLIRELAGRGLDGIEVYYPSHSPRIRDGLMRLARRHNLLMTGGSDYHGTNRKNAGLAAGGETLCPPDTLFGQLEQRIRSQRDLLASGPVHQETPCTPS